MYFKIKERIQFNYYQQINIQEQLLAAFFIALNLIFRGIYSPYN